MRRILTTICALIMILLFPVSILAGRTLPVDTGSYVEKKYAGWNGVLQVWLCCEWNPGGSFLSWLNSCAAGFEKAHNGVYVECTRVDREAMRRMLEGGGRKPELIFFSTGVLEGAVGLKPLDMHERLRSDLPANTYALPVALGGYIWAYNRTLTGGAPVRGNDLRLTLPEDGAGRSFAPAVIGLLSGSTETSSQLDLPDAGIDLGLPANAQADGAIVRSGDALQQFIDGEIPWLPVTQADLKKLNGLQESGRGPDWACAPSGFFAWTDQILFAGAVAQQGTAAAEREALAMDFAAMLLEDDAQQALRDAGAFAVTGECIHPPRSLYAELDGLLASLPLVAPEAFSEYSADGAEAIVRDYCMGKCSEMEALAKMGLSLTLPDSPN